MKRFVGSLTVLAVLASSASAPATVVTSFTLHGNHLVLAHPESPTRDVVVYTHGSGETTEGLAERFTKRSEPFYRLPEGGFAVATSDAHGRAWGNPASISDYLDLISWLHRHGFMRVYLLSQSMGGVAGLQLIDRTDVLAFAGIFPACNPLAMNPEYVPEVGAAWPSGVPSWLTPVRPHHVRGLPMVFWHSPADTVVPKATNTDVCAAQAAADGAAVRVITTEGEHGDPSNYRPLALLRFFAAARREARRRDLHTTT